jgi:hypothetical protein
MAENKKKSEEAWNTDKARFEKRQVKYNRQKMINRTFDGWGWGIWDIWGRGARIVQLGGC